MAVGVLFAVFLGMLSKEEPTLTLHVVKLSISFGRHVTIGCAACSDIAVHRKTAKPQSKRRRDVELEVEEAWVSHDAGELPVSEPSRLVICWDLWHEA